MDVVVGGVEFCIGVENARFVDEDAERRGSLNSGDLNSGVNWEVELMVEDVGRGATAHQTEIACIGACSKTDYLFPSCTLRIEEVFDELVDCSSADICACGNNQQTRMKIITKIENGPRFMMGNLRCPPGVANSLAYGS